MDLVKYQQYKRGEIAIISDCKNCTEEKGREYTGHVDIVLQASSNASNEFDTVDESPIIEALASIMGLLSPQPKAC